MFETPSWIGLYKRYDDGQYEVCKITFDAEPMDLRGHSQVIGLIIFSVLLTFTLRHSV